VLTAQDCGLGGHEVICRAAPGERPIISASIQVPGASGSPYQGSIRRAQVGGVASRQVFVNGVRATRARTSAWPAGFRPRWNGGNGIAFVPAGEDPGRAVGPAVSGAVIDRAR
jgi:hypothetical protein